MARPPLLSQEGTTHGIYLSSSQSTYNSRDEAIHDSARDGLARRSVDYRSPDKGQPFSVVEASIPEMQRAMEQGRVTSQELVRQYIARIEKYDSRLHATITVNRNALREARNSIASAPRVKFAALTWNTDRTERHHPHDQYANDRRRPRLQKLHTALRSDTHQEHERCRCVIKLRRQV